MTFEGLFDIEDWRKDAENSAVCHRNELYLTVSCLVFDIVIIVFLFYLIFIQIHAHFDEQNDFISKPL